WDNIRYPQNYQKNQSNTSGYQSDSFIGNDTYEQDWSTNSEFVFRYRANIYLYAVYQVNEYTVTYYVPKSNAVGMANTRANYEEVKYLASSFNTIRFNNTYKTLSTSLQGYTFLGWYISVGSQATATTLSSVTKTYYDKYQVNTTVNNDTIKSDSNTDDAEYEQNWTAYGGYIWDATGAVAANRELGGYVNELNYERSFHFRYTDNIYAYAVFAVNENNVSKYNVTYYVPKNNNIGSVNTISNYVTLSLGTEFTKVDFNAQYKVSSTALTGYTFMGWLISSTALTGSVDGVVSEYLTQRQLGYTQDVTVTSDSNFGANYLQNWGRNTTTKSSSWKSPDGSYTMASKYEETFYWRYTSDIYAYAYFTVNENDVSEYNISYYVPKDNLVGSINDISKYITDAYKSQTIKFNETFKPYEVTMEGYTFLGWRISYTKLTSGSVGSVTVQTLSHLQNTYNVSGSGNLTLTTDIYEQNWSVASGTQNTQSFTWRYLRKNSSGADIYAYAVYQVNESYEPNYTIEYYVPKNNQVGSANNIAQYVTSKYHSVDKNFNENITTEVVSLTGYTFKGWMVSTTKLSSGAVTGVTKTYLSQYQTNAKNEVTSVVSDSTIGNANYEQNWASGNTFIFRYTQDIYVYAYYEANNFTIKYYVPSDNAVGKVNKVAQYVEVTGLASSYNSINFNDNYQVLSTVLEGYTFLGWYVSESQLASNVTLAGVTRPYYVTKYQTNTTKGNDVTGLNDSTIGSAAYQQNWTHNYAYTAASPDGYTKVRDYEREFYFRHLSGIDVTTLYVYALFNVNENNYTVVEDTTNKINKPESETDSDDKYSIKYYIPNDNHVGTANDISKYQELSLGDSFELVNFNQTYKTHTTALIGYTFQGWYLSYSKLTSGTVGPVTKEYLSQYQVGYQKNVSLKNDSLVGPATYEQNWVTDKAFTWTDPEGYIQSRTYEREFIWRYTRDVYAYAVFTVNENDTENYRVAYYVPKNNQVGSVNNVAQYTSEYYTTTVNFNDTFTVINHSIIGYTFKGWFLSYDKLTTQTIARITQEQLYHDQYGCTLKADKTITLLQDDAAYLQNYAENGEFVWRYTNKNPSESYDIYLYAYYTTDAFNIKYYTPDNNLVGTVNDVSKYHFETEKDLLFNDTFYSFTTAMAGYTFEGWYVTTEALSSQILTIPTQPLFTFNYQMNSTRGNDILNASEANIPDLKYKQNWLEDAAYQFVEKNGTTDVFNYKQVRNYERTFVWRYTTDLYAYAVYTVNENNRVRENYKISYFVPQNNLVGYANDLSKYTTEATAGNVSYINFNE
ncbi:MAG: hypothetical protein IJA23_03210, partial [Clostridia bacterium]|nr:hypothetical protein [Clostridia bacterium]